MIDSGTVLVVMGEVVTGTVIIVVDGIVVGGGSSIGGPIASRRPPPQAAAVSRTARVNPPRRPVLRRALLRVAFFTRFSRCRVALNQQTFQHAVAPKATGPVSDRCLSLFPVGFENKHSRRFVRGVKTNAVNWDCNESPASRLASEKGSELTMSLRNYVCS